MIFSDIGCYSLGLTPPYNATDAMICMGAGISGAHGGLRAFNASRTKTRTYSRSPEAHILPIPA